MTLFQYRAVVLLHFARALHRRRQGEVVVAVRQAEELLSVVAVPCLLLG